MSGLLHILTGAFEAEKIHSLVDRAEISALNLNH